MIKRDMPDLDDDALEAFQEGFHSTDWKASPDAVLEAVDRDLRPHGLEVEMIETDSDYYLWRIVQSENPFRMLRVVVDESMPPNSFRIGFAPDAVLPDEHD